MLSEKTLSEQQENDKRAASVPGARIHGPLSWCRGFSSGHLLLLTERLPTLLRLGETWTHVESNGWSVEEQALFTQAPVAELDRYIQVPQCPYPRARELTASPSVDTGGLICQMWLARRLGSNEPEQESVSTKRATAEGLAQRCSTRNAALRDCTLGAFRVIGRYRASARQHASNAAIAWSRWFAWDWSSHPVSTR